MGFFNNREIYKGAEFSENGLYRYVLWRVWYSDNICPLFICLNPSTADAKYDDATVKKCIGFSLKNEFSGFYLVNLFAYRSTDFKNLKKTNDPIGNENDLYILDYLKRFETIILAWGNNGNYLNRDKEVLKLISQHKNKRIVCLGTTKSNQPKHPLMLSYKTELEDYNV